MLDLYHASREDLIALVVAHGDAMATQRTAIAQLIGFEEKANLIPLMRALAA